MEQGKEVKKKHRYSWIWEIPAKELPDRANDLWPSSCDHDAEVEVRTKAKGKRARLRPVAA
jgi:hypothetical protein